MSQAPAPEPIAVDRLTSYDIPAVLEIERLASPSPWSQAHFAEELKKPFSYFWVMRCEGLVAGFAGFWLVWEEAQLVNIAVHPDRRRQGHGKYLMKWVIQKAQVSGARLVTLEVREGNAVARHLYERCGFVETSRRPQFYEGKETAILMEKKF